MIPYIMTFKSDSNASETMGKAANPMIAKCYNAWKHVFHLTVKSQHDQVLLNYLSALVF